jgi:DNA-binding response OmpR family regulator
MFGAQRADLVISDLNMPNGDGETLAENLRRIADVPLIIISGFKAAERRALMGMPDVWFLSKPFESVDLVALVEEALSGRGRPAVA